MVDVKKKLIGNQYEVFTHNGQKSTGIDPVKFAIKMESAGAGELVINSIDRDGMYVDQHPAAQMFMHDVISARDNSQHNTY